jgi:hypothetical protein
MKAFSHKEHREHKKDRFLSPMCSLWLLASFLGGIFGIFGPHGAAQWLEVKYRRINMT